MKLSSVDFATYEKLVKSVGSLSKLFTENNVPFLSSKFVEKLFVFTSASEDLARRDMSFDAKTVAGAGVGVKTFGVNQLTGIKTEKVAEFTADATRGIFSNLNSEELALTVANYRNARVQSDARIYNIDLENSFYHCLVRSSDGCMIHEEPYELIDVDALRLDKESLKSKNPRFSDGKNVYSFSTAKNTLFKTFKLESHANSPVIEVTLLENVFELLLSGALTSGGFALQDATQVTEHPYVILPLYSTSTGQVEAKSGINQWNAGGRARVFGEAYIPHPKAVRDKNPDFFPPKDVSFKLRVPSGEVMSAKVCQADGKAIMSNPNSALCDWLYRMIDDSPSISQARFSAGRPYTSEDLARVGKDSVKISLVDPRESLYELEPSPLGSYERFMSETQAEDE
jgi:hypothetical protein